MSDIRIDDLVMSSGNEITTYNVMEVYEDTIDVEVAYVKTGNGKWLTGDKFYNIPKKLFKVIDSDDQFE